MCDDIEGVPVQCIRNMSATFRPEKPLVSRVGPYLQNLPSLPPDRFSVCTMIGALVPQRKKKREGAQELLWPLPLA